MSRVLTAYFSAGGTTARAAKQLAQAIGSDLHEILPEIPYTRADLNWMNKKSRSSIEMNNRSRRPALAEQNIHMTDYDVIFLGFPIWWGVAPTIVNTFLESHDFSGKKIVLFATSGGSGFGSTAAELRPSVAPDTQIIVGKLFHGRESASSLRDWAESFLA